MQNATFTQQQHYAVTLMHTRCVHNCSDNSAIARKVKQMDVQQLMAAFSNKMQDAQEYAYNAIIGQCIAFNAIPEDNAVNRETAKQMAELVLLTYNAEDKRVIEQYINTLAEFAMVKQIVNMLLSMQADGEYKHAFAMTDFFRRKLTEEAVGSDKYSEARKDFYANNIKVRKRRLAETTALSIIAMGNVQQENNGTAQDFEAMREVLNTVIDMYAYYN